MLAMKELKILIFMDRCLLYISSEDSCHLIEKIKKKDLKEQA